MKTLPKILIFDVNETLLDLSPLKENINRVLESTSAFDIWFSKLLQFAMAETLSGTYSDFSAIGLATLKMTSQKLSKSISEEILQDQLSIITTLKAHDDVAESLKKLKSLNFRIVALTNGSTKTVKSQIKNADLESYFDSLYSVEPIKKYKPHPDTYRYVLNQENFKPQEAMLIAAHAWDVMGAQRAGLQTAFIKRPQQVLYQNAKQPNLICNHFYELVENLEKTI